MTSQWIPGFKGLIKLQPEACDFIKQDILTQVFSCEFCEISKNTFFAEHLLATVSILTILTWKKNLLFIKKVKENTTEQQNW